MKDKKIYALGFFDGVHRGHQALLLACRHLAERTGCNPGVVTFDKHPETLTNGHAPLLINTLFERQRLLLSYQIPHCRVFPFNEELMNLPWQRFLENLLQEDAAGFVCGDDFRFGFRGEGNSGKLADFCRERNLPYAIVPAQDLDGVRVSSTYIRTLLESGQMEKAVSYLGHPHLIIGNVVSGRKLGRTIGIPTANLELPEGQVIPKFGVYACKTVIDGKEYLAVTNIGTRPTVNGHHVTVEPWILDFEGDLYGKELTLHFYAFLRPEQKFDSLEELRAEIQKNAEQTRKLLK